MENNKIITGYTTGIFDLFHIGHLNILKQAKSMCDRLIVGVSTDELAFSLKGKTPVIPFNERLEIIQSIRYVDFAVPETVNNKLAAWEELHFNILFKGDDWKNTERWILLEELFKKEGVKIHYFQYTKNTSSTIIRDVLNEYLENKQVIP